MQHRPTQPQNFFKTKAFKAIILIVYVYSFIQLDAAEIPVTEIISNQFQIEYSGSVYGLMKELLKQILTYALHYLS